MQNRRLVLASTLSISTPLGASLNSSCGDGNAADVHVAAKVLVVTSFLLACLTFVVNVGLLTRLAMKSPSRDLPDHHSAFCDICARLCSCVLFFGLLWYWFAQIVLVFCWRVFLSPRWGRSSLGAAVSTGLLEAPFGALTVALVWIVILDKASPLASAAQVASLCLFVLLFATSLTGTALVALLHARPAPTAAAVDGLLSERPSCVELNAQLCHAPDGLDSTLGTPASH